MTNLIKCLDCRNKLAKDEMHTDNHGHLQVCKQCWQKIRAKHRKETKRHRKATAKNRQYCQEQERKAKVDKLSKELTANPRKTPILTGLALESKSAVARKVRNKLYDMQLAKDLGLDISDIQGV